MKLTDTRKIMKKMEKALDAKRYEHTLGVAYTASSLAMSNGINFEKARLWQGFCTTVPNAYQMKKSLKFVINITLRFLK